MKLFEEYLMPKKESQYLTPKMEGPAIVSLEEIRIHNCGPTEFQTVMIDPSDE